jgi:hypothetical protein
MFPVNLTRIGMYCVSLSLTPPIKLSKGKVSCLISGCNNITNVVDMSVLTKLTLITESSIRGFAKWDSCFISPYWVVYSGMCSQDFVCTHSKPERFAPVEKQLISVHMQLQALYPNVYKNVNEYGSRYCQGVSTSQTKLLPHFLVATTIDLLYNSSSGFFWDVSRC